MPRARLRSALAALILATVPAAAEPVWVERPHVLYDPVTREVVRAPVRLADPHPEMALEFLWEPAAGNWPGVTPEGLADGPGAVTWRVPGTASYDPRAVHHRYEGTLRAGLFHGEGTLRYRDGGMSQGTWRAGRLEGEGRRMDADGNLYEGRFAQGRPEGEGIWRNRDGHIYEGPFVAGLRHGPGRITEPGGLSYAVVHDMGVEIASDRPALGDPMIGGLLPAQGGGDAARMTLSLVSDQRIAQQQSMIYTHYVDQGGVYFYPQDETLQGLWAGTIPIGDAWLLGDMTDPDWDETRAYALVDLSSTDGGPARLEGMDLVVAESVPHLQPMLDLEVHTGCVGFRPSFSLLNYGWGAVDSGTVQIRFAHPDSYDWNNPQAERPGTGWYQAPAAGFDAGTDVMLRDLLAAAGVDVAALETRRFTCLSADLLDRCGADAIASVEWGQLTGLVTHTYGSLATEAIGQFTYDWTDATGAAQRSTQPFRVWLTLGRIEVPTALAECGAGGAYTTEAPQFVDMELPVEGRDYRMTIPFRGNPDVIRVVSGLKLWSRRSAFHRMHVEARFADGSVRRSPEAQLFFLRPRVGGFVSQARPAQCYLDDAAIPSC
ncbi:hypothetical protein DXV76_03445 [Rhodobacteraceae bacterium CCMM004]|nr:hypothetical protein DXV76_03445 [Rhodobacteraceae bacterium CCMM004]